MCAGLCDSLPRKRAWKGKNSKFPVEKPGKHNLNQVMKFNGTCNKTCWWHAALIWCDEKGTLPLWYFPLNPQHGLITRKVSGKPKLRDILQNPWPALFKRVKIMKNKGRLENCHRSKETKKMSWHNAMWNHGLDPGKEKGHQWEKMVKSK